MSWIVFDRDAPNGNIFCILGKARKSLLDAGRSEDAAQMVDRVVNCNSYDKALKVIAEYVDLMEEHEYGHAH